MNQNIIFHYKKKKELNSINFLKEIKNGELCLNGSFTVKKKFKNKFLILRDQIGTYKLFYGNHKKNDKLVFSKNYCDLIKKCKINSIYSVPRNCVSEINSKGKIIRKKKIFMEKFNSQDFYRDFKEKIYFYLNSIKKKYGKTCYVCLSGGLDSAIIAYFASKVFKNPIAVTAKFKYSNEKNILSDDMLIANKVSKKLKIKIINLFFNYEDIEKKIPKILKTSQDWRDYNVHCATLNYFIAEKLSKKKIKNPVLTGDMMNEFCSDYKAETFQKKNTMNCQI